ncbi:hypothetical protein LTR04_006636 [Oleoguttula sp. CCFEE 6159]|nr:hypothetical protein LTR04_006636 [Oleoguttula sp. CCFEE 6159]
MAGTVVSALVNLRSLAASTSSSMILPRQDVPGSCSTANSYDGRIGVRISAVFVILVGSLLGAWFPVYAGRHRGMGVPDWTFFFAKYFGSGVIVATAFIHLLAPANNALQNPCLTGPITTYSWVEGIALMTIFVLFFVELMTMRFAKFGHSHDHDEPELEAGPVKHGPHPSPALSRQYTHGKVHTHSRGHAHADDSELDVAPFKWKENVENGGPSASRCPTTPHVPGDDHLSHSRHHTDNEDVSTGWEQMSSHGGLVPETYAAQMTAIFILEFGVIFHSIFIGLTLAVAGDEFNTLYVVLVFHQTFEGLALGSRLASIPWPKSKRWTPYLLAGAYGISTPIAISIGLGIRDSYPPGSQTTLVANGVFDSISAGILIYTGLVELMAHEFMFSNYMRKASIGVVLSAFGLMCLGAGLMALLGKWA